MIMMIIIKTITMKLQFIMKTIKQQMKKEKIIMMRKTMLKKVIRVMISLILLKIIEKI
jgi:hypothetical protein